ncbi:MAG: hypothetical protein WC670_20715 [Pseudolabrys sp.]|jgi:hypothetical protein
MNTNSTWPNVAANSAITPAEIDRVVRRARADRAEVMRAGAGELAATIKRFFAGFRAEAPRKGAAA